MKNAVEQAVLKYTGAETKNVVQIYGDASYRTYFRASTADGGTLIVMKLPDGAASVSEEITNYKLPKGALAYVDVSKYLASIGVSVPKILFHDKEAQTIILEDMGDDLFFNKVCSADDATRRSWYKKAVEELVTLQKKTARKSDCVAFRRSFDDTLLNWEFDHFLEYGIEARLGRKMDNKSKNRFTETTRAITSEIVKMDYIFTHRDFQSRNLMVTGPGFCLIDFQDALVGPRAYDIAALLRDSYVPISDGLLGQMLAFYCESRGLDPEQFRREFDLVTIQRKLKDAGRFVYIDRVKKNPNYLQYIPQSLEYVKKALLGQKKYAGLFDVLRPYVREWNNEGA